jgi:putative MATE family efflux protein
MSATGPATEGTLPRAAREARHAAAEPPLAVASSGAAPRPLRANAGEVLRLAWPAIVQSLVATSVFLTNRIMLGHYNAEALASMQVSGPVLWSVFMVFTAFTAGTVAVVGRSVGAGDTARARVTITAVVQFALVIGVVVGLAGILARGSIAQLLAGGPNTTETVRAMARTYMGILFASLPLLCVGTIGITALQASGDTRTPLLVSLLTSVVNVLGNRILIYGAFGIPELGVTGAALATASAFGLEAAIIVLVLARRRGAARLALDRPTPAHRAALASVLRVSAPSFAEKAVHHLGFLVYVSFIGRLGETSMAANQALVAIESVGFMTAEGFAIASGAIVAQKLGARRPAEASTCGWLATGMSIALLSLASLAFLVFPRSLVSLFTPEADIIALGAKCLLVAAIAQPFMAIADSLSAALRGAGDTRTPMKVALVGPVIVRVAATWFFAFVMGWGLVGVWIGSTCDWLLRAAWLALVFRAGRWKSIEV